MNKHDIATRDARLYSHGAELGAELRALVATDGRSVRAVARAAHMPESTLRARLRHAGRMSIPELVRVCGALGALPSDVVLAAENRAELAA